MDVAILSKFYGKNNRGAETFAGQLAGNLQSFGHKVNICPDTGNIPKGTQIVISTNGRLDVAAAKIRSMTTGAKLIVSGQSGIGWDDRLNLYTFPDAFVALTEFQNHWAGSVNPWVKVVTIPNGVDTSKFHPQAKPLKINLPRPIVLCVGAVTKSKPGEISKRQHLLKNAAAKIGASVLLVGRGGDMEVNYENMPGIYSACDLFSYPTDPAESFGIAMLEAMASGLGVVATDDPIRREIAGPAGLYVDPADTDAYAHALEKALNKKWGDVPRRQAERFAWDKVALQYHNLLKKL